MKTFFSIIFFCFLFNIIVEAQEEVYCRFSFHNEVNYGKVFQNEIHILTKAPWEGGIETSKIISLDSVKLLNPSRPNLIAGLIKSYKQSWKGKHPPKTVRWFIKPSGAAGIPGENIVLPASLDEIKVEVEMIIVIGKKIKNAGEDEAKDAIFGFTVGSDIMGNAASYHKINNEPQDANENSLSLGLKACDGFEPFGPFIFRNVDWKNRKAFLQITDEKNNIIVNYDDNTSNLLYTPEKIVSDLSKVMTLSPGDIISSGTGKSFAAKAGNKVEVSIDGLGSFTSRIVSDK